MRGTLFFVMILSSMGVYAQSEEKPLAETLQFSGDFRYRHQIETQSPKQQRNLQRIQARFGVSSQLHEDLTLKLRLMTGSSANSGNQTLGDDKTPGMPRRNFGLDQAYFDYKPHSVLNLYGGKMPQPFSFVGKNQMLLDRDITLEGVGFKFKTDIAEEVQFFTRGGMFWIRENYDSTFGDDLTDHFLNGVQTGLSWKPQDWTVQAGVGSFAYTGLKNNPPTNVTAGATGNGNTLDINGNYPTNFDIEEIFVEVQRKMGPVDLTLFFETLENKDASTLNKASSYGFLASYNAWGFSWAQQEVQKDAVVGAFTDSDFGGGVTSSKGQVWSASYKITSKVQAQLTVFKNKNAIDLIPLDYDRTHIDLSMAF